MLRKHVSKINGRVVPLPNLSYISTTSPTVYEAHMSSISQFPFVAFVVVFITGCSGSSTVTLPGHLSDGRVRLPNNWLLSPAGIHADVGELPLNMDITPDERYLVVTNNGTGQQSLSVIDTRSWKVVQTLPVATSWLGLRVFDGGKRLLVSGGNDNMVRLYDFRDGKAQLADSLVIGPPSRTGDTWIGGLEIDEPRGKVYVAGKGGDSPAPGCDEPTSRCQTLPSM